jgi:hypothetical protein
MLEEELFLSGTCWRRHISSSLTSENRSGKYDQCSPNHSFNQDSGSVQVFERVSR